MAQLNNIINILKKAVFSVGGFYNRDFSELSQLQNSFNTPLQFVENSKQNIEKILLKNLRLLKNVPIINAKDKNLLQNQDWKLRRVIYQVLDGEFNFLRSVPYFSCMVVLEEFDTKTESFIATNGIIYSPILGSLFYASSGKGAWAEIGDNLNFIEYRQRVSKKIKSTELLAITDGHKILPRTYNGETRQFGCSSLSLAYLISAKADLIAGNFNYIQKTIAQLFITEAGGFYKSGKLDKESLTCNFIAVNEGLGKNFLRDIEI